MFDSKIKVILAVFAILCLLYIVQFSITYIKSEKKQENFRQDSETEKFEDANQYSTGLALLSTVDSLQNQYNLTKAQKNEVVSKVFADVDSYKGKDPESLKQSVSDVINQVLNSSSAPISPPPPPATAPPPPPLVSNPPSPPPPVNTPPPATSVSRSHDNAKIQEIQSILSTVQSLLDDLKIGNGVKPSVETFKVDGFENNVRFSDF